LLAKQLRELRRADLPGITVGLIDDSNLFEWSICFLGPPSSP